MADRIPVRWISLSVALVWLLIGCSSGTRGIEAGGAGGYSPSPGVTADELPGLSDFLPAPADLPEDPSVPRSPSYTENDLVRHGNAFDQLMPFNKVGGSNMSAKFSSDWGDALGKTTENLGYCVYTFKVAGYDRTPEVRYGYADPPDDIGSAWIGLANWPGNRWDWFQCDSTGVLDAGDFTDYISGTDDLYVAVVQANDEITLLRYIQLGPVQVTASVFGSPAFGVQPLTVNVNLSASETSVGGLVYYDWDWDGDGVFDEGSDFETSATHVYPETGEHTVTGRAINDFGVSDTDSFTTNVLASWTRTWGTVRREELKGIAYHGDGAIFAVGHILTLADKADILLLKFELDGSLAWARTWGGPENDYGKAIAIGSEDEIYISGDTSSFGAGLEDVFIQRWDPDGNLVWTKTWGGAEKDLCDAMDYSGGAVYVAGETRSFTHTAGDWLVLKFDPDGADLWARTIGGDETDRARDITGFTNIIGGSTVLHLTGSSESFESGKICLVYAKLNDDGDVMILSKWVSSSLQVGQHVTTYGLGGSDVYLCGIVDNDILILEFSSDPGALSKTWHAGTSDYVTGLYRIGSNLVLCGVSNGLNDGTNAFLLRIAIDGTVQGTEVWSDGVNFTDLSCVDYFPGGGIVACGHGELAAGGSWSTASGTTDDVSGTWTTVMASALPVEGTVETPTEEPETLTGGVMDTGGGEMDGLACLRQAP